MSHAETESHKGQFDNQRKLLKRRPKQTIIQVENLKKKKTKVLRREMLSCQGGKETRKIIFIGFVTQTEKVKRERREGGRRGRGGGGGGRGGRRVKSHLSLNHYDDKLRQEAEEETSLRAVP